MIQREGRILRQGNENAKVEIYRYITAGSFDAYSWQLLETKQRFITGLLSGSYEERSATEVEDTILNYAEVKALAVGDPLIKKRVEAANELSKYLALQRKSIDTRLQLEEEMRKLPAQIAHQESLIENATKDMEFYEAYVSALPVPVTAAEKKANGDNRQKIREMISTAIKGNEFKSNETKLMVYHGFSVILPQNMIKEKPFVWIQRSGKYYVELGETANGILIRIDNFLNNFKQYIEEMNLCFIDMTHRKTQIQSELEKKENYTDEIENLKKRIANIDIKLGVNKK